MKMFHLSDPQHGWIQVTFGEEPASLEITASDVPNDCLRDLAAAVCRLLGGSEREVVEFSLEPDFAICELNREAHAVRLIVRLPANVETSFQAVFPLRAFAQGVKSQLLRIRSRYSVADGWTQPFPVHEVANLA